MVMAVARFFTSRGGAGYGTIRPSRYVTGSGGSGGSSGTNSGGGPAGAVVIVVLVVGVVQ